jgi:hypothetical protein
MDTVVTHKQNFGEAIEDIYIVLGILRMKMEREET